MGRNCLTTHTLGWTYPCGSKPPSFVIRPFLSFACGALWCATCGPATAQEATPAGPLPGVIPDAPAPSLFDPAEAARQARDQEDARWLADFLDPHLADGFDFPVGNADGQGAYRSPDGKRFNGWYVATKFCESYWLGLHTGEDWNGNGGGDTDLGQEVRAIGNGRVVFAGPAAAPFGNIVVIEHRYLENHQLVRILSQYDHLREVKVAKDQRVKRRELIGTIGKGTDDQFPAHLHFEIRKESMAASAPEFWPSSNGWTEEMVRQNYEAPSEFVRAHRKLLHPATSDLLVLAVKHRHQLSVIRKGLVARTVEMALSQKPEGPKQAEGDLRTPEGA